MKKMKISPYRYHDFRKYIEDWMQTHGVSLRFLSKELKMSPSFLSQVLSGKKELNLEKAKELKKFFKFDKGEYKHFVELISLSRSESHYQKVDIFNKIIKDKKYKMQNPNETEAFSYLNHWYYVALKEYFSINDQISSLKNIRQNFIFNLKNSELKNAIMFLNKIGYIEVDASGERVKVKAKDIDCYSDVYRISLGRFHEQMFRLAIESIEKINREERLILGNTVSLSEESYLKVKDLVAVLHDEIKKIENSDQSKKRVFHVGLAVFPLTKKE